MEGSKSEWHNKSLPLPHQNGSIFFGEKTLKIDIYPSVQSRAFPEQLYVSGELLLCKEADLRNHN